MAQNSQRDGLHRRLLEHRSALFGTLTTVVISVGGLVEIVPMYLVPDTMPEGEAVEPYTPLQVAGRDIYVREGCYNCHSQMVRPMRAETLRYGEWSRAAEYTWDRPFQLGSRRIGPDLHRVGGKYPDAWHLEHLRDPRSTSPGSIMPAYSWLLDWTVDPSDVAASVGALATLGHPYEDTSVDGVRRAMQEEADPIVERLAQANLQARPDAEVIAMIAYLQRLGTDRPERHASVP